MHGVRHLINKTSGHINDYTFVLSTRSHVHLGQLKYVTDINYSAPMVGAKELSFTVHWSEEPIISEYYDLIVKEEMSESELKALIKKEKAIWDQIEDLKFVWVKELNEYFEIKVRYADAEDTTKAITATSACEAELSQLMIYTTEINTEADIERLNPDNPDNSQDVRVTTFYNEEDYKLSLLHRILSDKAPHYSIKHVDASLRNMQRTFSIDGTSIYDFLTGECAEQFNCLFVFDSVERSISVYDLYTVCKNDGCRYRGDFTDTCPKCGNTDLQYFGEDTLIYIDKENLTNEVVFETNTDSIKNCFKLEAGDDIMTSTIRSFNPNGTDYIYYISEQQKRDMPTELVERLESYDALYESYTEEYRKLLADLYEAINQDMFYTSEMMPDTESDKVEVTAKTEADKLHQNALSPVALSKVSESTTQSNVENALLNYARLHVKTGYVKLEINDSEFVYNGNNTGTWVGNFKVTNYSNEEDVAESRKITVEVNENYPEWLDTKVKQELFLDDDKEGSIFDVLALDDYNKFKEALKEYGLKRLESFKDALQSVIDILAQRGHATTDSYLYSVLYEPYFNKLSACDDEINLRAATIAEWKKKKTQASDGISSIQTALNFANYLGTDLYSIFCSYRREEKYSNTNFISDGLDDAEMFKRAEDFYEKAKQELEKSAIHQHTISTTLQNLLLIPEFEPLLDKFALGNWIRVGVGKDVYRLRLIKYGINFNDLNTIDIEFSDLTKTHDVSSDVKDILNSAQSMATSYSYVSKQASKGNDAQATIRDWVSEGLSSAQVVLKNNQNEDVTIDKHGILCKSIDDLTEKYSANQMRITGNILAFTSDNWKTVSSALGEHDYRKFENGILVPKTAYGLTSNFVTSGVVNGSQIIGGDIYSENYSSTQGTHINLNDGSFSFGGGLLKYNTTEGLYIEGSGTFTGTIVAEEGGSIGGWTINDSTLTGGYTTLNSDGSITVGQKFSVDTDGKITASDGLIGNWTIGTSSLTGGSTKLNSDGSMSGGSSNTWEIKASGDATFNKLTAKNADIEGKITATDGTMNGLTITGSLLLDGGYLTTSLKRTTYNQYEKGMTLSKSGIGGYNSATQYWNMSAGGVLTAAGATLDYANITNATVTGEITATKGTIGGCTISGNKLQIDGGNITSGTIDSAFIGELSADKITSGTMSGGLIDGSTLTITEGATISTWEIDNNSIYYTPKGYSYANGVFLSTGTTGKNGYSIGGSPAMQGWMIGAGGNFGVTTSGTLYCNDVHLTGEITATSGSFTGRVVASQGGSLGGWDIVEMTITANHPLSPLKTYTGWLLRSPEIFLREIQVQDSVGVYVTEYLYQQTYLTPTGIFTTLTHYRGDGVIPAAADPELFPGSGLIYAGSYTYGGAWFDFIRLLIPTAT